MIPLSQVFWLTTILPGSALLCFLGPGRLGLFGLVARSYVLSIALFAPLIAAAYASQLPIAVAGTAFLVLAAASLLLLIKRPFLLKRFRSQQWWLIAGVFVLLVAVAPLGTRMHFDALVHVAKIRQTIDAGFSFQDPYSPLDVPGTAHMLGIQHGMLSIGSWLTGSEPHEFWFYSAWFQRLLVLGGIEALVITVYGRRRIAWTVLFGVMVWLLGHSSLNLPTFVAGYAVVPIVVSDMIRVLEQPDDRRRLIALFMSSLALASIHLGDWVTTALCLGLGAAGWLVTTFRGREFLARAGRVSLALIPGLPFLILVGMQPNHVVEQQGQLFSWMVKVIELPALGAIRILEPMDFLWFGFAGSVIALIALVSPVYRRRHFFLLSLLAGTAVVMFVPPVPGVLMHWLPHQLLRRARFVAEAIAIVGVLGGAAWFMLNVARSAAARSLVVAVAFLAGVGLRGAEFRQWMWAAGVERQLVSEIDNLRGVLREIGEGRPLVAADVELSLILPAVRELSVMSPPLMHANPGDGRLLERFHDLSVFMDPATSLQQRRGIAVRYGIQWVLTRSGGTRIAQEWVDGCLVVERSGFRLYRVASIDGTDSCGGAPPRRNDPQGLGL